MTEQIKPSGIDWIGDIPESWDVLRIKDIGTYRNGLTYAPEDIAEADNGTLVLRSSNIQNGKISYDDNVYVKCSVSPELMVKKGDIIICSRNGSRELIGKNAIIENSGVACSFGAFMMVYRCSCPRYMYYILNSEVFSYYLGTFLTSTINQLTGNNFGNMKIVFCKDRNEQRKIVDFLDKECAQIDSIAADLEKQIELLQQYKKSLVTETVTKGLDKSVPMKDSGVEWIGEIPTHWDKKRMKYFLSVSSGEAITSDQLEDGEYPVYGGGKQMGYFNKANVDKNQILIGRVGANCGCVTITHTPSWATDNALVVQTLCYLKYIYYILISADLNRLNEANAQPLITGAKVGNCVVPFTANYTEQKQIAQYLDERCEKIEGLIRGKQKQLKTIIQHKKSLIYEYVTGKKRVKEVQ